MRLAWFCGLVGLSFTAALGSAGEAKKERPFEEIPVTELSALLGDWQATLATPKGWTGTLRATATLKRNHPEESSFHTLLTVTYDLRTTKDTPPASVRGTTAIALFPYQKGKYRYVQLLRDFEVLNREYLLEVLDMRPGDKKARKSLADLRPSVKNTAGYTLTEKTWTLDVTPIVLEFLPKQAANTGPVIDWDSKLVWRKLKAK